MIGDTDQLFTARRADTANNAVRASGSKVFYDLGTLLSVVGAQCTGTGHSAVSEKGGARQSR